MFQQIKHYYVQRNREFSTRTSIHGFNELFFAKTTIGRIFWILCLLVCLSILSHQLNMTVQQYINEPYISVVATLKDEEMVYENLSICYQYWIHWVDFNKAIKLNFTRKSVLFGLSYIGHVISQTYFNVTEAGHEFRETMAMHKFTKISEFYEAIAKDSESSIIKVAGNVNDKKFSFENGMCYVVNSGYLLRNKERAKNQIKLELRIKSAKFYNHTNRKFYTLAEFKCYLAKYFTQNGNLEDNVFNNTDLLSEEFLPSMHLVVANEKVEIFQHDSKLTVHLHATASRWQNKKTSPCQTDQDVNREQACTNQCVYSYYLKYCFCYSMWEIPAEQSYIDHMCHEEILFFNETLGCKPLLDKYNPFVMLPFKYNDKRTCRLTANLFLPGNCCTFDFKLWNVVKGCKAECLPPCTKFDYFIGSVQKRNGNKFLKKDYEIPADVYFPTPQSILYTEEIDNNSIEKFFGNVGGILGIWMGASVLSIFQLIYLCCCNECSCCKTLHSIKRRNVWEEIFQI